MRLHSQWLSHRGTRVELVEEYEMRVLLSINQELIIMSKSDFKQNFKELT